MLQLRPWYGSLLELIAPARCLQCLREGNWLCQTCAEDVPLEPVCIRHHPGAPLTGIVSAGAYGTPLIQRGVHWLKFKRITDLVPYLAAFISLALPPVASLEILQQQAVLIPIPLHKRRWRERGFNQSLEIARVLEKEIGIPVTDILTRSRATSPQAKLPAHRREENVAAAFILTQAVPKKKYLLLLDDVTTTGSTLSAAAEVLKAAGKQAEIWGVTVARG